MIFHAGANFLEGGFIGADIFFVLSGFLITTLLIQEFNRSESINLRNFYIRRVLRLGPGFCAMLLVFCFVSFAVLGGEKANRNYIDALISLAYLSNWARAFSIHPPDFLGHTWTLAIEEQFYIVWPIFMLMLLRISKKRHKVALITATIALISWMLRVYLTMNGALPDRMYNGLDTRADALMVGCTLGIVFSSGMLSRNARKIVQKLLIIMAPLSASCLLTFSTLVYWRDQRMYYYGFFAVEILTAVLILDILVNQRSAIRKFFSMKWLVWVGTISYGLYIWHYPIFRTMRALGFSDLNVITIGTFATFFIAAISYYSMERPVLRLKKRFTSV